MRIAHIAAHIGGGVGSVLRDLFINSSDHENYLFCLDKCESNFVDFPNAKMAIQSVAYEPNDLFHQILARCDVVVFHYWNHPLAAKFLTSIRLPPCRLIFWCHNSGLYEPHIIPSYLGRMSAKILFTSSCSLDAPNTALLTSTSSLGNNEVVHSTRALDNFVVIGQDREIRPEGKNLLYVGTVSKSKMHPESAKILAKLNQNGYRVQLVGGSDHVQLASEVASLGGKIEIYGPVNNVVDFYKNADIFIYPLRSDHYGTGEQVILEGLAAGLPMVAFNNPAERAIIENGVNGNLASSSDEFVEMIIAMVKEPELLQKMSQRAIDTVQEKFNSKLMASKLFEIFEEMLMLEKSPQNLALPNVCGADELCLFAANSFFDEDIYKCCIENPSIGPERIYLQIKPELECLDGVAKWMCSSKSTPFHYLKYFPNCLGLQQLTQLIRNQSCSFN